METQTTKQAIQAQESAIEKRIEIAQKELARVQKRMDVAKRFEKLCSANDLTNRHLAGGKTSYLGGVYEYWQLEEENPVAAILFDCGRYSQDLEKEAKNMEEEREAEKRTEIVWKYVGSLCDRSMDEPTYRSISQGSNSDLAFCLKPVMRGIKNGERSYTRYEGNLREELFPTKSLREKVNAFFGGQK